MSSRVDPRLTDYIARVPKVELHVHLEGGIRPETLFAIMRKNGLAGDARGPGDLAFLYRHTGLSDFLGHFKAAVTSLRSVDDIGRVARDLFRDLSRQNILYAEVIFSAPIFTRLGLPLAELLAAVAEAAGVVEEAASRAGGASRRYNLVVDLVRNFGSTQAERCVADLASLGHPRVVGIHLGGDEARFPARDFSGAYRTAREAGLGLAAHAGEGAGAGSVRDAVELLGARRIGHGLRSLEDPSLVTRLAEAGVTLEICPTSNVATGLVPALARHPLPEFLARGVPVSLGSDDPAFFGTTLSDEMARAHADLGVSLAALDAITDTGLAAAFCPVAVRETLKAGLMRERTSLRRAAGLEKIFGKE